MSEQQILELRAAAEAYLRATTGPYNSPRIQQARHRLRAALEARTPALSERIRGPWPEPQADGGGI